MTQAQQSQAKSFSSDEVVERTAEYFGGDKMAGAVFLKYALPADDGGFLELSPPDMHARLARELARIENRYSNPMSEEEILGLLSRPSHRKLGMGPIIPQGSPMAGIGNTKQFQSISNCFVIDSPYDSFGGIFHTDEEEAEIMKRRGGVGFDVSTLRPKDVKTSNAAGTTDGIGVFLERYSATCRGTAQNGRRGALMLTISIRHPEIETFINIKRDLKKVTGANISIRVTDDFMVAVENDEYFTLQWPVDVPLSEAKITREVRARDIWDQIIDAAWNSAEPGVLFWDTVKRNSPADAYASVGFSSVSTNPCGEIPLSSGDSCRLLVVDLTHFVVSPFTPEAHFNFTEFERVVGRAQRLMDDIVDLEVEAVDRIIGKIESDPEPEYIKARELSLWRRIRDTGLRGRRTGFGITALGDALALLNMKYGQLDAIVMTDRIYRSLALGAYRSSVDLAEERGAFPAYDPKLEDGHPFLSRIRAEDPALAEKMDRVGRRNIALTTTAPVGSTSMLTQTTSGIEPLFKPFYVRKKKVSGATEPNAELIVDEMGDRWQKFNVYHHYLKEWMDVTGNSNIDESPYAGASANEIDWLGSVAIQAAAQNWVCHSISKTCNLPKDVSHDVVSDVYMNAWKTGCKGFTIYRDESRDGVLVSEDTVMFDVKKRTDGVPTRELERQVEIGERFAKYMPPGYISFLQQVRDAIAARKNPSLGAVVDRVVETKLHSEKRPKELPCEIHRVNVRAKDDSGDITTQTYIVLLGLLNGKPYEIFCGLSEHVDVPKKCKNGVLVKNGKKAGVATYNLRIPIGDDDDAIVLKDVVNLFENATYGAFTRILSLALRHEIPLQFVVEQLQKDKYSDMQSFSRVIARVLKHHILDGTPVSGEKKCENCGAEGTLVYEEKCTKCTACGNGKCG